MPLTKPTPRLFFSVKELTPFFCRKTHLKGGFFHWPCPDFAKGKVHKKTQKNPSMVSMAAHNCGPRYSWRLVTFETMIAIVTIETLNL